MGLVVGACSSSTECPSGATAREEWINTATSEYGGASPYARGFRFLDRCNFELGDKMLACDEGTVRSQHGGSPYLTRAFQLGATTYVCELAGTGERIKFPLAKVLGRDGGGPANVWK